jgi:hypothetical protein
MRPDSSPSRASAVADGVLLSMHEGKSSYGPATIAADLFDAGALGGVIIGGDKMVKLIERDGNGNVID